MSIRETVGFLFWGLTPARPAAAADLYGLLATRAFTQDGLWLNLGYWPAARTIDEASVALAMLVAETAGMGPPDEVVDVGFGFADQDMLWAERIGPRSIIGLNVTPVHVKVGRERVARRGLAEVIDLRLGSATAMPLPDASCDVVTALECAFHFDTREAFFAEAMRVLRPGGRLVLADIIRGEGSAWMWRLVQRKFVIPEANGMRRGEYANALAAAGFAGVRVDSISEQVFGGWHRALREDRALFRRLPLAARVLYQPLLRLPASTAYASLDYVLAVATKPGVIDDGL
jgi:ubiquinone/menaquinone biosynthesis C-methylase UbiE